MSTCKTVLFLLAAALLLCAASMLLAAQPPLNFDDLSGAGTLTDYGGLTWGPGWGYYAWVQGGAYPSSSGSERAYPASGAGSWCFTLPTPKVFEGAYFDGSGGATIQYNLYTLVDGVPTLSLSSGTYGLTGTPTFLPSGCTDPVIMVEVVSGSNRWIMDDVTFGDASTVLTVPISVSPHQKRNVINLDECGTVTVAILSTPTFDATTVDVGSVAFAGAAAVRGHAHDVNQDGLKDLVLKFRICDLDLDTTATEATLTGTTTSGQAIQGSDSVRVTGRHHCGKK